MGINRFIKELDMFGHDVRLNFNRKGYTHKTFLGGLVSLFIKTAIFLYVVLNVRKLLFAEDDKIGLILSN